MTAHAFEDRRQQARNDQPHSTGSGQRGTLYPQQKPSQRHPRQNPQPESVKPEVEAETPEVDEQLKPSETIMSNQDPTISRDTRYLGRITIIASVLGALMLGGFGWMTHLAEKNDADMAKQFEKIDKRFDGIDTRLDNTNQRLAHIEGRLNITPPADH